MTLSFRTGFFIILTLLIVWFLYLAREVLTPFIVSAIFAYIFNPVVNFLSNQIRLPRGLSIIFIYLVIIAMLGYLGTIIVSRLISESEELVVVSKVFLINAQVQISTLPPFLQDTIREPIKSLPAIIRPATLLPFFTGAFSGFVGVLIFLFSAFYFLKEGGKIFDRLSLLVPSDYRIEADILLRKINSTLGKYLRGQLLLVFIMAAISFIGLSIMGVRSSLLLALLIGFAEIVPIFGPLVAGSIATLFAIFDGVSRFNLVPLYEGLIIAVGYMILNQLENYLIVPNIMGKITKTHPLLILFSVLAAGHLFGVLGLILAVPVVATLRILLEYSLDKLVRK